MTLLDEKGTGGRYDVDGTGVDVTGGVAEIDTGDSDGVDVAIAECVADNVDAAVPEGVQVVVAVCERVEPGDTVSDAVALRLRVVEDVIETDAVSETDDVADGTAVGELESVVEGVGNGVVVAATGAGAMPRNWKPGAAVAIGTPPFV